MLPPTPPTLSLPLKLTSAKSWECSPANTSPFSLLFLSELSSPTSSCTPTPRKCSHLRR